MVKSLWSRVKAFFLRKWGRKSYFEDSFVIGYKNIDNGK